MGNEPSLTFNLILYFIINIPIVLFVYGISKRLPGGWKKPTLLTCIPTFGWFYAYYFTYRTFTYVLDELNTLKGKEINPE